MLHFCVFFFKGPSTAIDTACSSSLLALENAFNAIRHGQCDAALVGGVNLLLKPNTSVQFMKLGMLSPDGACKSFDASGDFAVICKVLFFLFFLNVYVNCLISGNSTIPDIATTDNIFVKAKIYFMFQEMGTVAQKPLWLYFSLRNPWPRESMLLCSMLATTQMAIKNKVLYRVQSV